MNSALFPSLAKVCFARKCLLVWSGETCLALREFYLSGFQNRHRYSTSRDDDDPPAEATMNQAQRDALFAGEFPADVYGEAIHLKTSLREFHNLRKAFHENEFKTASTVNLHFNAKFSRTSIYWKNTPIHQSVIGSITYQLRSRLSSPTHFAFAGDTAISDSLPIPDLYVAYTDRVAGPIETHLCRGNGVLRVAGKP
ncbi:hypothetical protein AJ80_03747 [Polytolypa hystricis UAMH7299]|uniref:Uncharacterized protein n=1 Tax=Polytolypa hystricis (strain UAMH7299) TaxID=1447883 RepID=A0A2B7YF63_POLH7|nr:hypothetical protein AJ80_03747 [Polytolypa hystricis UAMH7299]